MAMICYQASHEGTNSSAKAMNARLKSFAGMMVNNHLDSAQAIRKAVQ
jgi:hypothetical protein